MKGLGEERVGLEMCKKLNEGLRWQKVRAQRDDILKPNSFGLRASTPWGF